MPNFYTVKSEHADSKPGYDNTWQWICHRLYSLTVTVLR